MVNLSYNHFLFSLVIVLPLLAFSLFPTRVQSTLPIRLTSIAIPRSKNNYYSYDQQSVLFPHEPIRREMERGQKALEAMDVTKYPWKAKYFLKWVTEFFIPVIHDHHDAEEVHMGPFYKSKGVVIPDSVGGQHTQLVKELETIKQLSTNLVENPTTEKLNILRKAFNVMYDLMITHFADEEYFWPDAIRKIGEKDFHIFHKQMHTDLKKRPSGNLFLMSAFDCMGYTFDKSNLVEGDTRWCSEELLDDMLVKKIPYFVRAFIFPFINRKYQNYKKIILAVRFGTEDNIKL